MARLRSRALTALGMLFMWPLLRTQATGTLLVAASPIIPWAQDCYLLFLIVGALFVAVTLAARDFLPHLFKLRWPVTAVATTTALVNLGLVSAIYSGTAHPILLVVSVLFFGALLSRVVRRQLPARFPTILTFSLSVCLSGFMPPGHRMVLAFPFQFGRSADERLQQAFYFYHASIASTGLIRSSRRRDVPQLLSHRGRSVRIDRNSRGHRPVLRQRPRHRCSNHRYCVSAVYVIVEKTFIASDSSTHPYAIVRRATHHIGFRRRRTCSCRHRGLLGRPRKSLLPLVSLSAHLGMREKPASCPAFVSVFVSTNLISDALSFVAVPAVSAALGADYAELIKPLSMGIGMAALLCLALFSGPMTLDRPRLEEGDDRVADSPTQLECQVDELACRFGVSDREREVMLCIVSGYSYKATAAELGITEGTVQSHIKRLYTKIDVHSRQELIDTVRAIEF